MYTRAQELGVDVMLELFGEGHLSSKLAKAGSLLAAIPPLSLPLELSASPPPTSSQPTQIHFPAEHREVVAKMAQPVVQTIHRDPALLYVRTRISNGLTLTFG